VTVSPDGKRLVSTSEKTVKVWDAATGREVLALQGHTSGVNSVAASPDDKPFVSGWADRTVKVWDAAAGQKVFALHRRPHQGLTFAFTEHSTFLVGRLPQAHFRLAYRYLHLRCWSCSQRHGQRTIPSLRQHVPGSHRDRRNLQ